MCESVEKGQAWKSLWLPFKMASMSAHTVHKCGICLTLMINWTCSIKVKWISEKKETVCYRGI